MSGTEIAALIAAVAVAVVATVAVFVLVSLSKTIRELRHTVDDLRRETMPVVLDAQRAVSQANDELVRVDQLLDTAQSVGRTVDSASRLAYLTFSNPIVKVLAFSAGTGRAYRRYRKLRMRG